MNTLCRHFRKTDLCPRRASLTKRRLFDGLLTILVAALSAAGLPAAESTNLTVAPYLRIDESQTERIELQVAIRKLEPGTNTAPVIWLAAVTHIGETNYYRALQEHLTKHDLVLFEAVLPEKKGGWTGEQFSRIRGPIPEIEAEANLQTELAHSLGLAFQLEAIDYNKTNYRNSDISVEGIQRLMMPPGYRPAKKGEKPAPKKKSAQAEATEEPNESFDQLMQIMQGKGFLGGLVKFGVSMIAANPRLQAVTKLTFIEVLGGLKGDLAQTKAVPPQMAELLKVLIHGRNQVVVDDLQKELQRSQPPASISVFFGAGHMDDLERRIRRQLGYRPGEDVWVLAFGVDLKQSGISEWEFNLIRFMTQRQLQILNPTNE